MLPRMAYGRPDWSKYDLNLGSLGDYQQESPEAMARRKKAEADARLEQGVGSAAGGIGAGLGALGGGLLGTFALPGIGTAAGAGIGSALGGGLGSLVGGLLGSDAASKADSANTEQDKLDEMNARKEAKRQAALQILAGMVR